MQDGTSVSLEQLIEDLHDAICVNNRHINRLQKDIAELTELVQTIKQNTINNTNGVLY